MFTFMDWVAYQWGRYGCWCLLLKCSMGLCNTKMFQRFAWSRILFNFWSDAIGPSENVANECSVGLLVTFLLYSLHGLGVCLKSTKSHKCCTRVVSCSVIYCQDVLNELSFNPYLKAGRPLFINFRTGIRAVFKSLIILSAYLLVWLISNQ